jgi:hypothetical protein
MADDQKPQPDDLLEITWDDLNAPGTELPPAEPEPSALDLSGELFPPVEAGAPVADSRRPWIEITGTCGRDRRPFAVRFSEQTPGVYGFVEALPLGPAPGKFSGRKAAPQPLGGLSGQAQGRFDLQGYPGCPCCGQPGLVQCDRCGTVMCGSALTETKRGALCRCPNCGGRGEIASGMPVTVQGQVGGIKGKKR